jgi:hypothetical protein
MTAKKRLSNRPLAIRVAAHQDCMRICGFTYASRHADDIHKSKKTHGVTTSRVATQPEENGFSQWL